MVYTMSFYRATGSKGVGHKGLYLSPDRLPQVPNQPSGSSARVRTLRHVSAGGCRRPVMVLVDRSDGHVYVDKHVWQLFPECGHL